MTVEYAPGRLVDLYGGPSRSTIPRFIARPRTVLLWHGTQTDSRAAVRVLAEAIAAHGVGVIAPDWDSHAADRGRGDLLASVRFAQQRAAGTELVLVGWSLGGAAAAGLTVHATQFGVAIGHTVCLGGAFMVDDPITGGPVLADVSDTGSRTPFTLLVGDADDVIPATTADDFAVGLQRHDWPVDVVGVAADHGSIAGARYDTAADRYEPDDTPSTIGVARAVAAHIVAVAQND